MTGCHPPYTPCAPPMPPQRAMRWGTVCLLATLGLAACAPQSNGLNRDPDAPLGGTARFEAERFAGDWFVVASIGDFVPTKPRYRVKAGGSQIIELDRACPDCSTTVFRIGKPGVLRQVDGDEILVVMWVDDGFRTAALGTASGSRAAILDRRSGGSPDRIAAATEILDFYGWDISRLQMVTK